MERIIKIKTLERQLFQNNNENYLRMRLVNGIKYLTSKFESACVVSNSL